jgi:hypothetical protein
VYLGEPGHDAMSRRFSGFSFRMKCLSVRLVRRSNSKAEGRRSRAYNASAARTPRFLVGWFAVEEPSRWESSETDGRAERPTGRERRSQDVEIELAIAFSNVKKYRLSGKTRSRVISASGGTRICPGIARGVRAMLKHVLIRGQCVL